MRPPRLPRDITLAIALGAVTIEHTDDLPGEHMGRPAPERPQAKIEGADIIRLKLELAKSLGPGWLAYNGDWD